jgi:hypothetical protein
LSENSFDGQSDLSVPNLLETEIESNYNTGGEYSDGATTESDSSVDENGLEDNDENPDSDNGSLSSHENDTEGTQSTTRRYPERQRSKPRRLSKFTAVCHGESVDIPGIEACHNNAPVELDSPTLKQALNSNENEMCLEAINEELESLTEADTWELIDHPAGARVFPSKFVFKKKGDSGGIVERCKARLVLLGHLQRPDIDFFETYAPVVDFSSNRACHRMQSKHRNTSPGCQICFP